MLKAKMIVFIVMFVIFTSPFAIIYLAGTLRTECTESCSAVSDYSGNQLKNLDKLISSCSCLIFNECSDQKKWIIYLIPVAIVLIGYVYAEKRVLRSK